MSKVYEEDLLNAGKKQVIISNDKTKVIIIPELGGRIADVQCGDTKFLYSTYPAGVNFGPYTEYGGIEECIGGAPGTLWNTKWRWEQKNGGVLLQVLSKGILVRKLISLDEAEAFIKIEYSFFNIGDHFSKFTFGIHPEVSIAGSMKENKYHVPGEGGIVDGGYTEAGFKDRILPSEGWCAITHDGKVFGQMFPEDIVDALVVYYPKVDTHMVLEPIVFGVGVSPGKYAGFIYMAYMGDGDAEKIREMRAARADEFPVIYETFDRSEIPEDVVAELEAAAQEQAEAQPGFPQMPQMPILPKVQIPDIGLMIGKALEKVGDVINIDGAAGRSTGSRSADDRPGFVETGRTDDLPPDTEINVEHLKGDISISGWENQYIEHRNMRGNIEQSEGVVTIRATGDFSLKIPGKTPRISLNFVNGNVKISEIAASVEISGVNGSVSISGAEIPDDGGMNVSMVHGDINLIAGADSSFSLKAASLSDEVMCDLPLQDEKKSQNSVSGILNDGTADVALNTIRGKISIQAGDEE